MKRFLPFIIFCGICQQVFAQQINIDSLIKADVSHSVAGKAGPSFNPDSALKLLPHTKSPAARIKLIYDIILIGSGELNADRAFYYHHKILNETRAANDKIGEAVITGELGFSLCQNGDSPEGLKMLYDALKIAETTGNKQAKGIIYDNLGVCIEGNNNVRISYFKKALQYSVDGGDNLFACAELRNIGDCYMQEKRPDSAVYFLSKCLKLGLKINSEIIITGTVLTFGELETGTNLKLKYYRAALRTPYARMDSAMSSRISLSIADCYKDAGKNDSALFYAQRSYRAASKIFLSRQIGPVRLLAKLYNGINADSALKYATVYYTVRDSLYSINKEERAQAMAFAETQRQQEAVAQKQTYQTTLRLYLLTAVIVFLLVLAIVFWRNNAQNKRAKAQIEQTLNELKLTQKQLIQSEKMASLGELTAGIAHEIQNPLNFVNNFSEVNTELIDEMQQEIENGDYQVVKAIATDIKENQQKINLHGKRADAIVKGMLAHSKVSSTAKEPTDLNKLADEYLRLAAYHGLRSKDKSFNAGLVTNFDTELPLIDVVAQDIGRVMLSLFNNAFYAVNQKAKAGTSDYKPKLSVTTSAENGQVVIKIKDNGIGIPDAIKEKIMQPFFTTKPTGEGTGLGLSLTYDMVVKGHGGTIQVNSKEGEGSEFTISLPIN